MPTFGNTSVGASSAGLPATYIWGDGPFTPASNGDCESISVYSNIVVSRNYTLGLYDSVPTNLLRDTAGDARTFPGAGGFETFTLDSNYTVSSSASYWILFSCDGGGTMFYDTFTGEGGYDGGYTYVSGSMPSTIAMDSTSYNRRISIYATYTTGGGTTYYQSVAGSVTLAGALSNRITFGQAVVGVITLTGSIAKKISKSFGGSVTAAGSIAKTTRRTLAGSITLVGQVTKKIYKTFFGSVAASGALSTAYTTMQVVAGSITPSGALGTFKTVAVVVTTTARRMYMTLMGRR